MPKRNAKVHSGCPQKIVAQWKHKGQDPLGSVCSAYSLILKVLSSWWSSKDKPQWLQNGIHKNAGLASSRRLSGSVQTLEYEERSCTTTTPLLTQLHEQETSWRKNGITLPHPSYSPDLAPCDFPKVKEQLRGRRFQDDAELEDAVKAAIDSIPKYEFRNIMQKWIKRANKFIEVSGNYFEG